MVSVNACLFNLERKEGKEAERMLNALGGHFRIVHIPTIEILKVIIKRYPSHLIICSPADYHQVSRHFPKSPVVEFNWKEEDQRDFYSALGNKLKVYEMPLILKRVEAICKTLTEDLRNDINNPLQVISALGDLSTSPDEKELIESCTKKITNKVNSLENEFLSALKGASVLK